MMKYNPMFKLDPKQTNKFLRLEDRDSLGILDVQEEFSNGWNEVEGEDKLQELCNFWSLKINVVCTAGSVTPRLCT